MDSVLIRYVGNGIITIIAFTALYLIYAHRFSHRPFDYLWQGYICPTADYMHCAESFEPVLMSIHYVDRMICADETESTISIESIADSYPDIEDDVGFMYGCQRSEFHRSQLSPAQAQKGLFIDDPAPDVAEAPTAPGY